MATNIRKDLHSHRYGGGEQSEIMIPLYIRLTKNKSINLWLAAVREKDTHTLMRERRVVIMVVESNLKISINITYTL